MVDFLDPEELLCVDQVDEPSDSFSQIAFFHTVDSPATASISQSNKGALSENILREGSRDRESVRDSSEGIAQQGTTNFPFARFLQRFEETNEWPPKKAHNESSLPDEAFEEIDSWELEGMEQDATSGLDKTSTSVSSVPFAAKPSANLDASSSFVEEPLELDYEEEYPELLDDLDVEALRRAARTPTPLPSEDESESGEERHEASVDAQSAQIDGHAVDVAHASRDVSPSYKSGRGLARRLSGVVSGIGTRNCEERFPESRRSDVSKKTRREADGASANSERRTSVNTVLSDRQEVRMECEECRSIPVETQSTLPQPKDSVDEGFSSRHRTPSDERGRCTWTVGRDQRFLPLRSRDPKSYVKGSPAHHGPKNFRDYRSEQFSRRRHQAAFPSERSHHDGRPTNSGSSRFRHNVNPRDYRGASIVRNMPCSCPTCAKFALEGRSVCYNRRFEENQNGARAVQSGASEKSFEKEGEATEITEKEEKLERRPSQVKERRDRRVSEKERKGTRTSEKEKKEESSPWRGKLEQWTSAKELEMERSSEKALVKHRSSEIQSGERRTPGKAREAEESPRNREKFPRDDQVPCSSDAKKFSTSDYRTTYAGTTKNGNSSANRNFDTYDGSASRFDDLNANDDSAAGAGVSRRINADHAISEKIAVFRKKALLPSPDLSARVYKHSPSLGYGKHSDDAVRLANETIGATVHFAGAEHRNGSHSAALESNSDKVASLAIANERARGVKITRTCYGVPWSKGACLFTKENAKENHFLERNVNDTLNAGKVEEKQVAIIEKGEPLSSSSGLSRRLAGTFNSSVKVKLVDEVSCTWSSLKSEAFNRLESTPSSGSIAAGSKPVSNAVCPQSGRPIEAVANANAVRGKRRWTIANPSQLLKLSRNGIESYSDVSDVQLTTSPGGVAPVFSSCPPTKSKSEESRSKIIKLRMPDF